MIKNDVQCRFTLCIILQLSQASSHPWEISAEEIRFVGLHSHALAWKRQFQSKKLWNVKTLWHWHDNNLKATAVYSQCQTQLPTSSWNCFHVLHSRSRHSYARHLCWKSDERAMAAGAMAADAMAAGAIAAGAMAAEIRTTFQTQWALTCRTSFAYKFGTSPPEVEISTAQIWKGSTEDSKISCCFMLLQYISISSMDPKRIQVEWMLG